MSHPEDFQPAGSYTIAQLTELHDWCRAHGVSQVRVGNIHMVLDELPVLQGLGTPVERRDSTAGMPRSPHAVIRRKAGQEE